jgi:F-type H+-transporting ATPase subunit b
MLDIEPKWFLILIGIFLANIVILNALLFKPMLRVFKEREEAIDGSLEEAREMESEKDSKITLFKREMSEASLAAREKFDALKQEGQDRQKEQMEAASKEAMDIIEKARAELSSASDSARASLKGDVDRFSEEIVQKLLKV